MKRSNLPGTLRALVCIGFILASMPVSAQDQIPKPSKPVSLDEALREPVPTDRAASYYYFALAKLKAGTGDLDKALSYMKKALDYNRDSSAVNLEMAALLVNMGKSNEAITYAQEASRLDPQDPDPHWVLARIYLRTQPSLNGEFAKAVRELEIIRDLDPQNGNVYYALGGAYFEQNEPEKAIQAYEKFQSIVRDTDSGYLEIAKYYYGNKDNEKAIEYLKKALEIDPESLDSLNLLGRVYTELNRIQDAIPVYRKLAQLVGNDLNLKQFLASLLYEDGEYDEANELLVDVLSENPGDNEARILLGRVQIEQNEYSKAIETLRSVGGNDPKILNKAKFHEAIAYKDSNQYAKAIEIFRSLLDATPGNTEENKNNRLLFQYNLVSIYLKQGNNEEAVSIAKQGYDKDPGDLKMAIFYAQTLADAGRIDDAVHILNGLLQSNPSEVDLYIRLSQVLLQGDRYREAEDILKRAETIDHADKDKDESLKIQLVSVYEKQKDYDRAESLLKEVLQENPNHAGALNYFGYMLADRGIRLGEAVNYVKKALEIDPENGAYLDSLGWAYFKLNDFKNAEKYLLKAGRREKDDPVINDHLGDLYFKTGDFEKARNFWMQSIRVSTEDDDVQKVRKKLDMLPGKIKEP